MLRVASFRGKFWVWGADLVGFVLQYLWVAHLGDLRLVEG